MDSVWKAVMLQEPVDIGAASDRELLARAAERDDAACFELVTRYGERLFAVVEKSHGDLQLSDDIVQDAIFRAIEKQTQLRDGTAFFPWIVRIALHHAADYRRKVRRESLVDMFRFGETRPATETLCEAQLDSDRDRARVRRALTRLKPYHRELLVLRYYAQLSVEELCQVFKKRNAAIRKDLQRARDQLERRLPDRFGGEP